MLLRIINTKLQLLLQVNNSPLLPMSLVQLFMRLAQKNAWNAVIISSIQRLQFSHKRRARHPISPTYRVSRLFFFLVSDDAIDNESSNQIIIFLNSSNLATFDLFLSSQIKTYLNKDAQTLPSRLETNDFAFLLVLNIA